MRTSSPFRFGGIRAQPPPASPGQRIGLLGGSFNPPHRAHVLASETALKRLGIERVWWLVSPQNPIKSPSGMAAFTSRLAAARAFADDPRIIVTGFEAELTSRYTAATLAFLKQRRSGARFVWLMGADCLAGVHRWAEWRAIFATYPIAVIDRPGWRLSALSSPAAHAFAGARRPETRARLLPDAVPPAWIYLSGPLSTLSSTELRRSRGTAPPRS